MAPPATLLALAALFSLAVCTVADAGSGLVTLGLYSNLDCTVLTAEQSVSPGACIANPAPTRSIYSHDFMQVTCAGDSWTVRGFPTDKCLAGTGSHVAEGGGKGTCVWAGFANIKVACDGSAFPVYDHSGWLGSYTTTGCDRPSCCCMRSVTIARSESGSGLVVSGPLFGNCDGKASASFSTDAPTSDVLRYRVGASDVPHMATRNPLTGGISDLNGWNSLCVAELTKTNGEGGGGGGAVGPASLMTVALFSDLSCTSVLTNEVQPKEVCQNVHSTQGARGFFKGSCVGDVWTVDAFESSYACAVGSVAYSATGGSKAACVAAGRRSTIYIRAACDGSSLTGSYDPTGWLGSYTPSGCNPSQCCCLTSASIVQSGTTMSLAGPVSGVCGGLDQASFAFATPASDSVVYYASGQKHTATRSATTGSISDVDTGSSSCSTVLTKRDGSGGGGSVVATVAMFSDWSCTERVASVSMAKGACVPASDGGASSVSCSGDSWALKSFRASGACTGTPAAQASGSGKDSCQPMDGAYVRVACDGSTISPAALHSASAFVVMALAALAAMAMRA